MSKSVSTMSFTMHVLSVRDSVKDIVKGRGPMKIFALEVQYFYLYFSGKQNQYFYLKICLVK